MDTITVFGPEVGQATPVTGDRDGNGTTTVGVFIRPTATWMLRNANVADTPGNINISSSSVRGA